MGLRRSRVAMLLAALLCGAAASVPAAALGAPASNAASSRAYVLADHALAVESERNVPRIKRGIRSFKRRLVRECRRAAVGSPQDAQAYRLDYEIAGALWSISYGTDAGAIKRFAAAVAPLRWSNRSIGTRAEAYAQTLRELAALRLPHVCADVRAWRSSGYTKVPARTLRFDKHVEALEPYILPAGLLKRYLGPAEVGMQRTTARLENRLLETETLFGGNTWYDLLEALDLNE